MRQRRRLEPWPTMRAGDGRPLIARRRVDRAARAGQTMLKHLWKWLRHESSTNRRPGRLAGWLGRGWARFHYATRVEPTWLELNNHAVPIADLPAAFHGFRLVQLSDFHGSRHVTTAYLSEAVELAQAQHPDLTVLTGDFVHKG